MNSQELEKLKQSVKSFKINRIPSIDTENSILLEKTLRTLGLHSTEISSRKQAQDLIQPIHGPSLWLIPWKFRWIEKDLSVLQLCSELHSLNPSAYLILLEIPAEIPSEHLSTLLSSQANDFLIQPICEIQLRTGVLHATQSLKSIRFFEMARNINHSINNCLSVISLTAQRLESDTTDSSIKPEDLLQATDRIHRNIEKIIQILQGFSTLMKDHETVYEVDSQKYIK